MGKPRQHQEGPFYYVAELKEKLKQVSPLAQQSLSEVQAKRQRVYNQKVRQWEFQLGQRVLLLLCTTENKLLIRWHGPYQV